MKNILKHLVDSTILHVNVALALAIAACFYPYGALGALTVLSAAWAFKQYLDRVHPVREPEPTGADLRNEMVVLRAEVRKDIEGLAGQLSHLRAPAQKIGLRQ